MRMFEGERPESCEKGRRAPPAAGISHRGSRQSPQIDPIRCLRGLGRLCALASVQRSFLAQARGPDCGSTAPAHDALTPFLAAAQRARGLRGLTVVSED